MYLLDSSAILAHCFQETGFEVVAEALESGDCWVAAPSWFELRIALARTGRDEELVAAYRESVAGTLDITTEVADAAFAIRRACKGRIPAIDSLIAGAAKVRGFRLIHRDRHLAQIPAEMLDQTSLPARGSK